MSNTQMVIGGIYRVSRETRWGGLGVRYDQFCILVADTGERELLFYHPSWFGDGTVWLKSSDVEFLGVMCD